jgi:Zn finger protein HypA/HybF involved in hydrogenase expression
MGRNMESGGIIGYAEIKCLNCGHSIRADIIRYGDGYIALCPKCDKLAYNSKEAPSGIIEYS